MCLDRRASDWSVSLARLLRIRRVAHNLSRACHKPPISLGLDSSVFSSIAETDSKVLRSFILQCFFGPIYVRMGRHLPGLLLDRDLHRSACCRNGLPSRSTGATSRYREEERDGKIRGASVDFHLLRRLLVVRHGKLFVAALFTAPEAVAKPVAVSPLQFGLLAEPSPTLGGLAQPRDVRPVEMVLSCTICLLAATNSRC